MNRRRFLTALAGVAAAATAPIAVAVAKVRRHPLLRGEIGSINNVRWVGRADADADFFKGAQWSENDIDRMRAFEGKPLLFNQIRPAFSDEHRAAQTAVLARVS